MEPTRRFVRALAAALLLAACGGVEGDLLAALDVPEQQELCVGPQYLGVDAFRANDGKQYVARAGDYSFLSSRGSIAALERLQAQGYVSREATRLPQTYASSFDAYEITPKGAEFIRPDAFDAGFEVRIGTKRPTEIVEYTEPSSGAPALVEARFRYELELNDFVDDLGLADALAAEVQRDWPGEGNAVYTKTNKGWRLEQAFWH